ncbi:MAG: hypothetical protein IPF41_05400 [Flavobacteriales bacterium]|nr:hypothetical protein [Flavobacteriales bacterium]
MEHAATGITDERVEVRGLRKAFGSNVVLDGFDLDLRRGENLVVLDKSGSGKTCAAPIKCIMRLPQADAGTIRVPGR